MRKWYETEAINGNFVIYTRICLSRNLKQFPFQDRMTDLQRQELNSMIQDCLKTIQMGENTFSFYLLRDLTEYQILQLSERHLVHPDITRQYPFAMLAVTQDDSISLLINGEDHIQIQVLKSGMAFQEALTDANRIDNLLDASFEIAFDEEFGYLTACPTNLGTGLRASAVLHLLALERTGVMATVMNTIGKLGMTIRPENEKETEVADGLYQISNQITLGISEELAIQNLTSILEQVMSREQAARERMLQQKALFEDTVWRSFGVLQNARILSEKECRELLSNLRIGIWAQLLPGITPAKINTLLMQTGTAEIAGAYPEEHGLQQKDMQRACIVRKAMRMTEPAQS